MSQTLSREAGEISARYSIDFVLPTDAGQYIVQAENEYGMTETTGWVNVVTGTLRHFYTNFPLF